MLVEVCDNCKRPFEKFECEGGDDGWGIVIDKKEQDPVVLMSDLTFCWCCFTDEKPEREPGKDYWCVTCVDSTLEDV
jgi:hypothetical protein